MLMKKYYSMFAVFALLLFGSCQKGLTGPRETTTKSIEITSTPSIEYPPWWNEIELSLGAKKNRDFIFKFLWDANMSGKFAASTALAEAFDELGIPEIKEITITGIGSVYPDYSIRLVDINNEAYNVNIRDADGVFYHIYREGDEEPIYTWRAY